MSTDTPRQAFVPFIQLLRGVAPLLVVWPHLTGLWLYNHDKSWTPWTWFVEGIQLPLHLADGGGHLGVVIFFLISGFIISHVAQTETRLQFAVKRLFRIFPPLAFAIFLMFLAASLSAALGYGPIIGNDAKGLKDYLLSATLLNYPVVRAPLALSLAWSLYAEVIFYVLACAFLPMMKTRPLRSTVLLSLAALALILPMRFNALISYHVNFTVYLPLFMVGRALYLERTGAASTRDAWLIIAGNFLVFCLIHSAVWPGALVVPPKEPIASYAIGILIFAMAINATIGKVPRVLRFFAEISYSLYLVHLPVGMLILNASHAHGLSYGIGFGLALGASILVAMASHKLIERPMQSLANRLLARRRVALGAVPAE